MPSSFDDLFADVVTPALQDLHGESVTHYPAGVVASGVTVAGVIFQEADASYDTQTGRSNDRSGTLLVPTSVTLLPTDRWLIRSISWETESVGGKDPDGLNLVKIVRAEETDARRHDQDLR